MRWIVYDLCVIVFELWENSFSIPQEKLVPTLSITSPSSFHSKLCQWTWATAVFGAVETTGLVSMAAPQPLTRAAQAPPRGLLLTFPRPPLGLASQLWWTRSAPPWWLSPSHKHNHSPADITCTPPVSTLLSCRTEKSPTEIVFSHPFLYLKNI